MPERRYQSFDFVPKALIIISPQQYASYTDGFLVWLGQTRTGVDVSHDTYGLTWSLSGKTLSWYDRSTHAGSGEYQANSDGITYMWVAFG